MKHFYSPSEYHSYLVKNTPLSMTYKTGGREAWQKKFRKKLLDLAGGIPSERVALQNKTIWKRDIDLGTIEKVVFRSEPFADVPAYVCIPDGVKPPYRYCICLQGHSTGMHNSIRVDREDEKTAIEVKGDRDFAYHCMKRGIAAICVEQRSFGLRRELLQKDRCEYNGCHDAAMHSLMLGRTLLGERVFDVSRTIDYLRVRGDADMGKVGIMGNSGGGTISLFAAALLPEISYAMPSCYFCTFKDGLMSLYHCGDNYIPGLLKYGEIWDIAGLIAPRPLVIVAGKADHLFPIKAVRSAYGKLKEIYADFGAEKSLKLVVGNEGHRFYADKGWSAMLKLLH